jgi:phage gp16-like protein
MAEEQARKQPKTAHLKKHMWKPGQSGNPGGRPKGASLTNRLRKALDANDGQLAEVVVKVLLREAAKGKYQHLREVLDRVDGKVVQKVELNATVQQAQDQFIQAAERVLEPEQLRRLVSELGRVRAAMALEASGD